MAVSKQTKFAVNLATFAAFYFVIIGGLALLQLASYTRVSAFWFGILDAIGLGVVSFYFASISLKQVFSPDMVMGGRSRGTPKVSNDSIRPVTLAVGYLWWAFAATTVVSWVWWHKTGNVLKDDGDDNFDLRTVRAFVFQAMSVTIRVSLVPFSVASTNTARNAVQAASGDFSKSRASFA